MRRKFIPFWLFLMLFKFGAGLHYSLLAPLGERVLPLWLVGLIVGGGSLIQLSLDVPAGYLLDKFGYKKFLAATTLIFLLAALTLLYGLTTLTFILTIILGTFGWLFFGPGVNAYVIHESHREEIGKFLSLKDMFMSLGIVLSSVAIIFVIVLPVSAIGLFLAGIFICTFIAILWTPKEHHIEFTSRISARSRTRLKKNFLQESFKAIHRLKPVSILLLSLTFSGAVFYATIWFVVPLLIAHSVQNGILGVSLGIFDFAVVVLGFALGWLVDSYEKKILVFLGLFLFSICAVSLGFNFGILFLVLGFLATTGDELASLSLWAWLYSKDRNHTEDGLISGTINLFEDLGWAVGPMIAGVLYEVVGPTWTLSVGGLFIFANLVLFFFLIQYPFIAPFPFMPKPPHRRRYKL